MIAAISGSEIVNFVVWLIVAGIIFFLLNWLIDYVKVAEPFNKVLKIIIAVAAVLVIINALLALTGNPVVKIG